MPKLKTNRGASKRFKKKGSGIYKHRQCNRNHILTKKSSKRLKKLKKIKNVNLSDFLSVKKLLPN